jgi:N-acetylneuraminic acid mutarotase
MGVLIETWDADVEIPAETKRSLLSRSQRRMSIRQIGGEMSSWSPATSILNAHQMMGAAVTAVFPPPPLFPGGFVDGTIIVVTARLYVVGGSGASGDVEAQSKTTGAWSAVPSLLTPRFGHAVAVGSDHRIYALGGRSNPGATLLSMVEGYTPTAFHFKPGPGFWTAVAPMPTARERAAAATGHDGVIYVAGGSNGSTFDTSSPLKTLEAYHASTNSWKTLAHMNTARDGAAAVTGTDGHIYVIGGVGVGASGSLNSVEAYDPTTDTWATVTPMTTHRDGLGAVLGEDGQIYAIGGEKGAEVLSTVEVYNIGTKTWTAGPSMANARVNLAAAIGTDGRIYAIGGNTGLFGPTTSVEALTV